MLTPEQVAFFNENSYLRLEQVFSPDEVAALDRELSYIMETFIVPTKGLDRAVAQRQAIPHRGRRGEIPALRHPRASALLAGLGARDLQPAARRRRGRL